MDKRKQMLRKYLDEQDLSWQILFGLFFLKHVGLSDKEFEFDIGDTVKFANDEQDFETIYSIIEYLNFHEDEIAQTIQKLCFKPVSWQYDFIDRVSEITGFNIQQTLDKDSLTTAYGYALLAPQINIQNLCNELDLKYVQLFKSASEKMKKLKRNFVLALECMLWPEKNADKMNFRELLNLYVPHAGIDEVVRVYKHALSSDIKLTTEEKSCLAFAYYSPFFCDEVNIANGSIPEGSIFFCAEARLQEDKDFYNQYLRIDDSENYDDEDEDEDENAEYEDDEDENTPPFMDEEPCFNDSAPFNHLAVYVDPLQRCIIDSMLCDNAFANVYIEKLPQEKLNCTLPDFIRYHKGCLYTVEFVDNIKNVDIAQKLNRNINLYETEIKCLNDKLQHCNDLPLCQRFELENKLSVIQDQLSDCYFIS